MKWTKPDFLPLLTDFSNNYDFRTTQSATGEEDDLLDSEEDDDDDDEPSNNPFHWTREKPEILRYLWY